jgi:ABC-2 type transport system ATP-binding protein
MREAERKTRTPELLETFGLADAARRKFQGYSRGMKRKLTIAAGIVHRPRILFLDEPTTGLDVARARQIRQLIVGLHRNGTTILLTTHYIEEAERLCDRIAFIVAGRIVRTDTVANLMRPVQGKHEMFLSVSQGSLALVDSLAQAFPRLGFKGLDGGQVRVESAEPILVAPLVRFLERQGVEVTEARKVQPTLEEVFVEVTGIETAAMKKENEKAGAGA